jgi:transcriptional regulator with XRE-family HTH domain
MSKFSEKLQKLMDDRGWGPSRLAALTGIEPGSVRLYLKGKVKPSIKTLGKICEVLNVSPDYLIFDEEEDI